MQQVDLIRTLKAERDYLLSLNYVKRKQESLLKKALNTNLIKVITGPRRSGKSTIGIQVLSKKEDFFYINFDNSEVLKIENLVQFVEIHKNLFKNGDYLFLDEIQNIPSFEIFVTQLQRLGYNIVLTGSNANLLSRELSTRLTGRYTQIEIFPFSFEESKGIIKDITYMDYLMFGGFPEQLISKGLITEYLPTLFNSIILKDIVQRYDLRNTQDLSNLSKYLLENPSQNSSYNKITNKLNISSVNTTIDYYSYLMEAFLISKLHCYSNKTSEIIKSGFKTYAIDTGLFINNPLRFKSNIGYLFENSIFNFLLTSGFKPQINLFQLKNTDGTEIDFILKKEDKSILVQVCLSILDNKSRDREMRSLLKSANRNYKKVIIVLDDEEMIFSNKEVEVISINNLNILL